MQIKIKKNSSLTENNMVPQYNAISMPTKKF